MIRIGKYKIGALPLSVVVVLILLSAWAVIAAFVQARPEWPLPVSEIILINECMAMVATLIYGILAHFAIALIRYFRSKNHPVS